MVEAAPEHEDSFDGCYQDLYNHLKVRAVLEDENAAPNLRGHSDTEILLYAVRHRGSALNSWRTLFLNDLRHLDSARGLLGAEDPN